MFGSGYFGGGGISFYTTSMTRVLQTTKKSNVTSVTKAAQKTVIVAPSALRSIVELADIGPSGPSGASASTYTHTQSSPQASWTITHNLGYNPGGVSVVDSAGSKCYGDVTFVSENQLVVNFSSAFSGKAYIS